MHCFPPILDLALSKVCCSMAKSLTIGFPFLLDFELPGKREIFNTLPGNLGKFPGSRKSSGFLGFGKFPGKFPELDFYAFCSGFYAFQISFLAFCYVVLTNLV